MGLVSQLHRDAEEKLNRQETKNLDMKKWLNLAASAMDEVCFGSIRRTNTMETGTMRLHIPSIIWLQSS